MFRKKTFILMFVGLGAVLTTVACLLVLSFLKNKIDFYTDQKIIEFEQRMFYRFDQTSNQAMSLIMGKSADFSSTIIAKNKELQEQNLALINKDFHIVQPKNEIFQHENKMISFSYKVIFPRGKLQIELKDSKTRATFFKSKRAEGRIEDVPIGMYEFIVTDGKRNEKKIIGVGDVFLVAGQSNAVSPAQEHPPHYSSTQKIWINHFNDFSPDFVIPTQSSPLKRSISWIYLGDQLAKRLKIPIGIINVAQGATTTHLWKPTNHYLAERIKAVLKKKRIKAVLWHQGESDSLSEIPMDVTLNNLRELINYSKTFQKDLDWFIAKSSMLSYNQKKKGIKVSPTRLAQKKIVEEGLAFRGPDTDILRKNSKFVEKTKAEFVGEGLSEHANMWYEILMEQYYRNNEQSSTKLSASKTHFR